jgi:hypothetical protein
MFKEEEEEEVVARILIIIIITLTMQNVLRQNKSNTSTL